MFFMRLRRGTKPVFILLAAVFALSFVFLGVGSGSSGIGDLLRGNFSFGGGTSGPSVDKARDKIRDRPNDPAGYRELATALETKGENDAAIRPLTKYTQLRPKDVDALRELAALHLRRADEFNTRAQLAQAEAGPALAQSIFAPDPSSKIGQALGTDPIYQSIQTLAQTRMAEAYSTAQTSYKAAVGVYKRIAAVSPSDPTLQLELAQAAEAAGDTATAVGAYERFLKLAPDDPTAPQIKKRIKELESQPTATG